MSFFQDSVASRIIQTTKQQYLANDIPLSRFVTIGIDVCPSVPVEIYSNVIDRECSVLF